MLPSCSAASRDCFLSLPLGIAGFEVGSDSPCISAGPFRVGVSIQQLMFVECLAAMKSHILRCIDYKAVRDCSSSRLTYLLEVGPNLDIGSNMPKLWGRNSAHNSDLDVSLMAQSHLCKYQTGIQTNNFEYRESLDPEPSIVPNCPKHYKWVSPISNYKIPAVKWF